MSIRIKLILTYAILILVSVSVLFFSGMAIVAGFFSELSSAVIEENQLHEVMHGVIDLLAELKQAEDYEEQKLINPDYIKELNKKVDFLNGGIIVRYKDTVMNYSDLPNDEVFYKSLVKTTFSEEVSAPRKSEEDYVVRYHGSEYIYLDYSFKVENEEVMYFFIADVTSMSDIESRSGNMIVSVILVILFIIMTPLLIILSNDIIKPLKMLEYGVKNVKEGNLDFKLEFKKKNEIGRVIEYFDVMRMELKKSIDKQVQYEDNRKELISSISHDLKTPITSIKGHVEGIIDGVANTPEKLDKYLNVIYKKSQDMEKLIDDLFLFSKFDLDRIPFEMEPVKIMNVINEVVHEMKLEWENDTQKIDLKINDKTIPDMTLNIDQQQIKRVLVNLIQNSMKYMDKDQKEITLTINDHDAYVQIVVADNGMGIEEQHLKHLFESFYRVDESRNSNTGGTGLGLAIAKQIIERHDGHIFVTSVLGEGTQIIIELKKQSNDSDNPKEGQAIE